MEAIVLAGGYGTRLRSVVSDVPKPMAPMDEKGTPFLKFLLDDLLADGINHIVLATGYKHEVIRDYFGIEYNGVPITYSVETEPLLTGGAIRKALMKCMEDNVLVLNGDTYFKIDYNLIVQKYNSLKPDILLCVKKMYNSDRYGTVELRNERITKFCEKRYCAEGYINGGVYYMNRSALQQKSEKFSFEDFLSANVQNLYIAGIEMYGCFIDIGIPSDYEKAKYIILKNN